MFAKLAAPRGAQPLWQRHQIRRSPHSMARSSQKFST